MNKIFDYPSSSPFTSATERDLKTAEELIEAAIEDCDYGTGHGALETQEKHLKNLIAAFGRLVHTLHQEEKIDTRDVYFIAGVVPPVHRKRSR